MFPGAQHLQNFHPLVIHFPIALLMGAALLYMAASLLKSDRFAQSAFVVLVLGALSLVVAVATGLYAEQGVMVHLSVRTQLLAPHKRLMLVTSGLCTVLTGWAIAVRPFPKKGRPLFLLLLLVMIGVMTVGADFGGRMVYDYNAGGSACRQPIQFTK
ncbi:MAG: DUF2231 domain-containing protein [Candidatus Omnitrophica bacterium]|nr:DUF2231 domain-containing protein [Candidatus Omnitrophota bacterium]MBI3021438.1 DUF2231 domain-containing protein [Candidatus Omnitrophota bacterium]MBI3083231.1 DUF2231 domain-containing protein [Candidatus Omnitrophota bacterium]